MNQSARLLLCSAIVNLTVMNPAIAAGSATVAASGGAAPQTTTSSSAPATSSQDNNYFDDGLVWGVDIPGWSDPTKASAPDLCIPANTRIMGRSSTLTTVTAATPAAGSQAPAAQSQYLQVELNPTYNLFTGRQAPVVYNVAGGQYTITDDGVARPCKSSPSVAQPANIYRGQQFYVSYDDLANVDSRSGFESGVLVVPFKAELSGAKAIAGSATVGGYLGYNQPWMNEGISFRPIIFAGLSPISTTTTTAGTSTSSSGTSTSSQTLTGLSYGFGIISTIKSNFQVGVVLGFDHVASAQPYAYNDKPWLSLEVGYTFAQ